MDQEKDSLEYAFRYFDLHAKQRMTVFNFFLAISGALVGLIAASLGGDDQYPFAALALSLFLFSLSYLFWQLDIRTSFLIKHAEASLEISEKLLFENHGRLVGNEKSAFDEFQENKNCLTKGLSYSRSFHLIFALMAFLATVGLVLAILKLTNFNLSEISRSIYDGMIKLCRTQ